MNKQDEQPPQEHLARGRSCSEKEAYDVSANLASTWLSYISFTIAPILEFMKPFTTTLGKPAGNSTTGD